MASPITGAFINTGVKSINRISTRLKIMGVAPGTQKLPRVCNTPIDREIIRITQRYGIMSLKRTKVRANCSLPGANPGAINDRIQGARSHPARISTAPTTDRIPARLVTMDTAASRRPACTCLEKGGIKVMLKIPSLTIFLSRSNGRKAIKKSITHRRGPQNHGNGRVPDHS